MKIYFTTNIDRYKHCFPTNFSVLPRKGDFVEVLPSFVAKFQSAKLPFSLEVRSVTFRVDYYTGEQVADCELWFSELQYQTIQQNKIDWT